MKSRKKPILVSIPRPKASDDLLDLLDSLVAAATEGQIESFALVATRRLGETQMAWHAPDGTLTTLLGEIEIAKHRLMNLAEPSFGDDESGDGA